MIGVLIVDDSAVVRANLAHILGADPDIRILGTARNGNEALAFVARQKPDVITMDIQMPEMDGFEVTRRIMESAPVPIIIVSAIWSPDEQALSFKALEAGAVSCLAKPPGIGDASYCEEAAELVATVKQMAEVKMVRRWPKRTAEPPAVAAACPPPASQVRVVALGASTGGPPAVGQFLSQLPADFPVPVLIVQHISRGFARGFVDWLGGFSPLPVYLATHHETVWKGRVYVAPDDLHMGVAASGKIELSHAPHEHYLRPSASYLFRSVAEIYGPGSAGILLTGMGTDGADGLKKIKEAGGLTFAQDKESSVVHGMPGEAIRLGAADYVLPPAAIAKTLTEMIRRRDSAQKG